MRPIFQKHICLSEAEIISYRNGTLDGKERHRIENHLLDCPFCDEAMEGFMEEARTESRRIPLKSRFWSRLAAAAMILLLPLAGIFVWKNTEQSRLYQAFYEPYESDLQVDLRTAQASAPVSPAEERLVAALKAYESGHFAESIPSFEQFLEEEGENAVIRFYMGIANMEIKEFSEAIRQFEIALQVDPIYHDEVSWYLALSLIHEERNQEAKNILTALTQRPQGRYYEKAKDLVSKL